jgi:very-short-patch-repair endonuclease
MLLIEICGGRVWRMAWLKNPRTGFCFVWYKLGPYLHGERIAREVKVSPGVFVDFGVETRYYKRAIEVLGGKWHQDILAEQKRRALLRSFGWQVLYIEARLLWQNPQLVKQKVERFLSS